MKTVEWQRLRYLMSKININVQKLNELMEMPEIAKAIFDNLARLKTIGSDDLRKIITEAYRQQNKEN